MATAGEPNDEDDKLRDIDREISELRSAKKVVFERTRKENAELERIAQRERECVDIRHRLRSEQHERERHQPTVQRVIELEAELKQAKCENVKLSDTNRNLKQSLDQAAKFSKAQKRKIAELENNVATVSGQSRSETGYVVKLQKQLGHTTEELSRTKEELNETRQRLSDVQERLTVAQQVTAATQQRALQESNTSEQLELEVTQQQPTTSTGFSWQIVDISDILNASL